MALTLTRPAAPPRRTEPLSRRDEITFAFFSTWVIIGLFVDGWAHNAGKPESFFTPWHGILYSGFAAGMLWGAVDSRRQGRSGLVNVPDRLALVGIVLFAVSGVADMVWHEIFGVEADVEALLSPTHLLLMMGGLFLTTAPLRSAWRGRDELSPSLRQFGPALVSVTLSTALLGFFVQFGSVFRIEHDAMTATVDDAPMIYGLLAVQLTNVLFLGAALLVLRRWHPPAGTFTVLFSAVAVFMASQLGFEHLSLTLAALAAGVTADVLTRRARDPRTVAGVTAGVLWATWFAVYALDFDLRWTVELWSGSIFFAVLTAVGLALLAFPPSEAPA